MARLESSGIVPIERTGGLPVHGPFDPHLGLQEGAGLVLQVRANRVQVAESTERRGERVRVGVAALATSLAVLTAVPWSICFLSYSLLHLVYPADRKRALAAAEPQDGQALAGPTEVNMGAIVVSEGAK